MIFGQSIKMFFQILQLFCLFQSFSKIVDAQRKLPDYLPTCYKNDPNMNQCLLAATEKVRSLLEEGVPDFQIPSINPLKLEKVTINQGPGVLQYTVNLTNVVLTGLNTYTFHKFEFDAPNLQFVCSLDIGKITLNSNYSLNGTVFQLSLVSDGNFYTNMTGIHADVVQHVKHTTRNNIQYFELGPTNLNLTISDLFYTFDGLFSQDPVLKKAVREALSANGKEFLKEFHPVIEETIISIMRNIINDLVEVIPVDEIFPLK